VVDTISAERRSWNMSRIAGSNTKPELLLRSGLHRAGYRFRLHAKDLPGKPDIVLRKYRTAIFVHGCFWHRHPGCRNATLPSTRTEFWTSKFEGNVERDLRNTVALKEAGWTVLIVWECDLKSDPQAVVMRISQAIKGD
jgi:DNA mismatch endonuclease (patch repair protein)